MLMEQLQRCGSSCAEIDWQSKSFPLGPNLPVKRYPGQVLNADDVTPLLIESMVILSLSKKITPCGSHQACQKLVNESFSLHCTMSVTPAVSGGGQATVLLAVPASFLVTRMVESNFRVLPTGDVTKDLSSSKQKNASAT
ncbi:hypothetical protein PoB_002938000 [Plakobranchus ocellatus]|uniref:Uncharacterized protein n=1 Tax=Plakobranchus ocellatus TaxID=259542 RepID=A0AAV4A425_9GAST|nr:hypothetical protein PoB_002938000 [Plakobranchus ocellatus]